MTSDCLKLTVYCGERDRSNGQLTSDVLLDLYERRGLQTAILVRGMEGFGVKHQLRTQRLLTLSEDLPLVVIAVDTPEKIEALLPEAQAAVTGGLVTIERTRLVTHTDPHMTRSANLHGAAKLTLYLGRQERVRGRPAYAWAVDVLRQCCVAGATVALGVDGMTRGVRQRARFFSRNIDVPVMVISVGAHGEIANALSTLREHLDEPRMTLERVRILKSNGVTAIEPPERQEAEEGAPWQKLTVYAGEQARYGRRPLYVELIHRLRLEGASGVTVMRGILGYSGAHRPHADRLFAVRRRVPIVITLVDEPDCAKRWWRVINELTSDTGLVTSERVPVFHAPTDDTRPQLVPPDSEH